MDPIEALAYKVAYKVKSWNPNLTADIEDIQPGAAYYINYYSVIVISLIIGLVTHEFWGTALSLFSIGLLRKYSGGRHLSTLSMCAAFTITVCSIVPHIQLEAALIHMLNIINWALVTAFTMMGFPKNMKNKRLNLAAALLIVSSNFFVGSSIMALSFFVQAVSLIRLRR